MKNGVVVEVVPGPDPLPFIAEYCPFVWLHTNCNSDGNAASPDDRRWSWLHKSDRHGSERFELLGPSETGRVDGVILVEATSFDTARRAAYLTALRTGGRIREGAVELSVADLASAIPDLDQRLQLADEWRERCFARLRASLRAI